MNVELSPFLDTIARRLDRPRRDLLLLCSPFIAPFIKNRALRVHCSAIIFLAIAFAITIGLPCWQLALGPIILGIPHIIGDVRYLVLQEELHKNSVFWMLVAAPLLAFLYFQQSGFGAMAIVGATLLHKPNRSALPIVGAAIGLMVVAFIYDRIFLYSLLHLHNVIAIAIWWRWRKNRKAWEYTSLVLCAAFCIVILVGFRLNTAFHPTQLPMEYFTRTLVPFASGDWAIRLVLLYAFLQSFHYFIWVRLIPEDNRKQQTPQSFRKSLSTLQENFGEKGIFFIALSMVALIIWACFDIKSARANYLYLISFHGFLELAVCGYYLSKKRTIS